MSAPPDFPSQKASGLRNWRFYWPYWVGNPRQIPVGILSRHSRSGRPWRAIISLASIWNFFSSLRTAKIHTLGCAYLGLQAYIWLSIFSKQQTENPLHDSGSLFLLHTHQLKLVFLPRPKSVWFFSSISTTNQSIIHVSLI